MRGGARAMLGSAADRFRAIWVVDYEFAYLPTGKPDVICLAAKELHTGRSIALWRDEIGPTSPYDIGDDAVVVFYSGSEAELACHLALDWPLPVNVVDLMVEYRMAINGHGGEQQLSMLAACARFGLPARISPAEKDRARARILRGEADRDWTIDYCRTDIDQEVDLLRALLPDAL